MKKLSRNEMKNVKGGSAPVGCTSECNRPQALCGSLCGCSTGEGAYNWKCCSAAESKCKSEE